MMISELQQFAEFGTPGISGYWVLVTRYPRFRDWTTCVLTCWWDSGHKCERCDWEFCIRCGKTYHELQGHACREDARTNCNRCGKVYNPWYGHGCVKGLDY